MKKKVLIVSSLCVVLFFSCGNNEADKENLIEVVETEVKTEERVDPYAQVIEQAHQKQVFFNKEVIEFDLNLYFGGKERLKGKLSLLTNSTKGKIEFSDGRTIVYNEDGIFHSSNFENPKSVRFDAYTWSYFFLFPYKLNDPGTKWMAYEATDSLATTSNTKKLMFEPGTGDAPKDWYITYANKETNLLSHAAYIVTANKTIEEAEKDPHGIHYSNYIKVDDVPFATEWTFWAWRDGQGFTKQLGNATLTNISFQKEATIDFNPGEDFVKL